MELDEIKDPLALVHTLAGFEQLLAPWGWSIYKVAVDSETGAVAICAETRNVYECEGRHFTVLRARGHEAPVLVGANRLAYKPGQGWGMTDPPEPHIEADLAAAIRRMLDFICEHNAKGPVGPTIAEYRRRGVALHLRYLAEPRYDGAIAAAALDGEPLTAEWLAEFEETCCPGRGAKGSTSSDGAHGRQWLTAWGSIVDGLGREAAMRRGPKGSRA